MGEQPLARRRVAPKVPGELRPQRAERLLVRARLGAAECHLPGTETQRVAEPSQLLLRIRFARRLKPWRCHRAPGAVGVLGEARPPCGHGTRSIGPISHAEHLLRRGDPGAVAPEPPHPEPAAHGRRLARLQRVRLVHAVAPEEYAGVRHHGAVDLAGQRRAREELAAGRLDDERRLGVEALAGPEVLVPRPLHPPVHGEIRLPDRREDGGLTGPAHLAPLLDQGDEALVGRGRLLHGEGAEALRLVLGVTDQGVRIGHRTIPPSAGRDGGLRVRPPRTGLGTEIGAAGAALGAGTGSTGDGPRARQDTSNRRSGRPVRRLIAVGPRGVGRGDSPPVTATRPVRRSAT